jgi:hypothetical protein
MGLVAPKTSLCVSETPRPRAKPAQPGEVPASRTRARLEAIHNEILN